MSSNTPHSSHKTLPSRWAKDWRSRREESTAGLYAERDDALGKSYLSNSKTSTAVNASLTSGKPQSFFPNVYWTLLGNITPASSHPDVGAGAPSWHQYVRAPSSTIVSPKAVVSQYTKDGVVDPENLITGRGTSLQRSNNVSQIPTVVLDFGQNVVGQLEIDFNGSVSYASQGLPGLKLSFSETLEFLTNRSDFTRSDNGEGNSKITPGTDQIAVQSDPYTWIDQLGCEHGTQVCSDGLHGFRYVKLELDALESDSPYTAPAGYISISSVRLRWSGYLGTPETFTGYFECSDTDITQWWYDAAYTNEMNIDVFRANDTEPRDAASPSLLDKLVIHDGPKRDRDPYIGDLAVSALTAYLTHDVQAAARNVMEDVVQYQRSDGWIPPASIRNYTLPLFDYPLWWVSCSWDYVYYNGNLSYVESYYSNLKLLLDDYYPAHTDNNTSLLLRPDGYGDYAFLQRPGSAAYYSALYVLALERAADLADLLSQSSDSDRWRQRATLVANSFVKVLWDSASGAFFDRRCADAGCGAHAQDGNSLAILSGIIAGNSTEAASLLAYLSKANAHAYGNSFYDAEGDSIGGCAGCSQRVYPFISYFEIAARFEAGQGLSALDQIRRMYGWMASQDPGITAWEGIGAGGVPYEDGFTSMAHGWSTGVVPLVSNYVLGVKPVKPGFEEWRVQPVVGDLSWARGVVPTPKGPITVQWSVNSTGIDVCVDAPVSTQGTVGVSSEGSRGSRVVVNGVVVWDQDKSTALDATSRNGYVEVKLTGGDMMAVGCLVN